MNDLIEANVVTINPEQGKRCLALLWKARVPAALIGPTGVGKTTMVQEFVGLLNGKGAPKFKLWMAPLSYYSDAGDIGGIPVPDHKAQVMKFLLNGALPFDTEEAGVLFGDEFDRSSPEVQNAFLQVLLGGVIHGHKLSENVYPVIAMNGSSDVYTTPLSQAARTRVCSLFLSHHAAGTMESYLEWAEKNGVSRVARRFARARRELLAPEIQFEELAVCVPRTLDMADKVLSVSKTVKFRTDDIVFPCLAGLIGKRAAVEFLAIERLIEEAPDLSEILQDPKRCAVPKNPSVLTALISELVSAVDPSDLARSQKIIVYGTRWSAETAWALFKQMAEKDSSVVTLPEYIRWTKEHKAEL